jgi:histidinol phosphatase-like PHP family hydrolase
MIDNECVVTNRDLGELLARQAEEHEDPLRKAFKRASRLSLFWKEEASELLKIGRSLTELPAIGPFLERFVRSWIENPPDIFNPEPLRADFLSSSQARQILAKQTDFRAIRGDFHMHSLWSDGTVSIQEMAEAAQKRNYEYIGITDHSKGLKIARGINELQLLEQGIEIDQLNNQFRENGSEFRILKSTEVNLSPKGEVDMSEDSLRSLDMVIGSFHSSLRKIEDQTERYLAALRNPFIHILGHPRGRIYNFRMGLQADWQQVFDCAAQENKAVEINCFPDRQDLNVELLKIARDAGTKISIGTDSHRPEQLEFIELGLAAAIVAGVPKEQILNFYTVNELMEWKGSLPAPSGGHFSGMD